MTYIRMTGGRDRGYVKDFPIPEAREMLALGQALPVDFNEPDALGFRELASPVTELQLAERAESWRLFNLVANPLIVSAYPRLAKKKR